jgi:hypothetical protein
MKGRDVASIVEIKDNAKNAQGTYLFERGGPNSCCFSTPEAYMGLSPATSSGVGG